MRILLLAPVGAFFIACSDAGSDQTGDASYISQSEDLTDGDTTDDEEDLTGGYDSCKDALRALGEEPWDWENADNVGGFRIYFVEENANPRPWVATISQIGNGEYYITCDWIDHDGYNMTPVKEGLDEYWNCAFQYNLLSIHDPASDPGCNQGYQEYAEYYDNAYDYPYVQASPGRFVLDEDGEEHEDDTFSGE